MKRLKPTTLLFAVVLGATLLPANPVSADCVDPTDATPLASTASGFTSLAPLTADPLQGFSFAVSGSTVRTYQSENLSVLDTLVLGDVVENAANPVSLSTGQDAVFVSVSDGTVVRLDIDGSGNLTPVWTKSLRRGPGCTDDKVTATPAVHLLAYASPAFQATYTTDVVYVPTRYGSLCGGSSTTNRIYALDAETGIPVWTFNATATVDMDIASTGGWLDYDDDRLYVGTERTFDPTQHSLWAIDVITGTAAWSTSAGRLQTTPTVRGDRIYVGTLVGEVKALNKTDGSVIWTESNGGIPTTRTPFVEFRPPYADLIGVSDLFGDVWLVRDDTTVGTTVWTATLPSNATSRPFFDSTYGKVFVGAQGGKVYQLNITDGSVEASRQVDSKIGATVGDPAFAFEDSTFSDIALIAGSNNGDIKKFCSPWSAMMSPVAPEGDGPPVYAAPAPGVCSADADCGSPPSKCSTWKCLNQVCAAQPIPDGSTCDDGNDFTSLDSCESGVCSGKSDCERNLEKCACRDDAGKDVLRNLYTLEITKGEADAEVVTPRASMTCLPVVTGLPKTGGTVGVLWVHLFDQFRRPIVKPDVFMIQNIGGSGDPIEFYDPKTGEAVAGEVSLGDGFLIESKRPGTFFTHVRIRGGSTPSDPFEPQIFDMTIKKASDGHTCIDTKAALEVLQVRIRTGALAEPSAGGCGFFGDTDESNFLQIEVFEGGDPVLGVEAQAGPVDDPESFWSDYHAFIQNLPPDLPNIIRDGDDEAEDGKLNWYDFGNNLNGAITSKETGDGNFPVVIRCPTGNKFKIYPSAAYERVSVPPSAMPCK